MKTHLATFMMGLCFLSAAPRRLQSAPPGTIDAHRWVGAKFLGQPPVVTDHAYLLAYIKRGGIDRNTIDGKPLLINSRRYQGGIHFSSGRIVVHLPRAAQRLDAVVGADSNRDDAGYGGRGSFTLSVEAGGSALYHSEVMHEGMTGVPISVNLGGVKEFALELKPAEIGKPWDSEEWNQADWADARVVLADGSSLALADLPTGPPTAPYTTGPPFSFRYGDQPSSELLKTWEFTRTEHRLDSNRTGYMLSYRDPKTALVVRCEAVAYADFPTVEWTVYFKNEGNQNTPLLEQIQALDTQFARQPEGEFILHHAKGSQTTPTDFPAPGNRLESRAR